MTQPDKAAAWRPDAELATKFWIGVLMVFNAWNIIRTAMIIKDLVDHADPRWKGDMAWVLPAGIALSVVMILALTGVLLRRKLGVYAAVAAALAAFAINLYMRVPPSSAAMTLLGVAVLIALLVPRWSSLR